MVIQDTRLREHLSPIPPAENKNVKFLIIEPPHIIDLIILKFRPVKCPGFSVFHMENHSPVQATDFGSDTLKKKSDFSLLPKAETCFPITADTCFINEFTRTGSDKATYAPVILISHNR